MEPGDFQQVFFYVLGAGVLLAVVSRMGSDFRMTGPLGIVFRNPGVSVFLGFAGTCTYLILRKFGYV